MFAILEYSLKKITRDSTLELEQQITEEWRTSSKVPKILYIYKFHKHYILLSIQAIFIHNTMKMYSFNSLPIMAQLDIDSWTS